MLKSFIWILSVRFSLQKSTELGQPAQGEREFWVTWGGTWRIFFTALFKLNRLNTELSNMPGTDRCFRQCHLNIGLHITHRLSPIAPSPIPVPATDLGPFFEMRMRDLVLGFSKKISGLQMTNFKLPLRLKGMLQFAF